MTANVNVTKVLFRRGNTAQNAAYTGINGEVTVDTQAKTLRIHDGVTAGGNVITAGGVVGAYSNTNAAAYIPTDSTITSLQSNAATQAIAINTVNANVGAFQSYANITLSTIANAASQESAINSINANVGAYQTFANANASSQATEINSLRANITAANAAITSLQSNAAVQAALLDTLTGNAATQSQVLDTLTTNAATQATTLTTLLSNAVAQQTSLIDLVANAAVQAQFISNTNANTKSYLAAFDGNIIPAANVTYSLGDSTHQWKDLWVSNNTIYIGNTPIRVDGGTLLVNNAPVSGGSNIGNMQIDNNNNQLSFGPGESYSFLNMKNDGSETRLANDNGNVQISTIKQGPGGGTYFWTFDDTGNILLPNNSSSINYANGVSILSGLGGAVYGNIVVGNSEINFVANSSGDGYGFGTIELRPDTNAIEDSYLIIDPTYPSHIHIRAGGTQDNSLTELYLGGENSHFKVNNGLNPDVSIAANNYVWLFGTDGSLTFPTGGNVIFDSSSTSIIDGVTDINAVGTIGANVIQVLSDLTSFGASPAPRIYGFSSIATTGSAVNEGNISASGNLVASQGAYVSGNVFAAQYNYANGVSISTSIQNGTSNVRVLSSGGLVSINVGSTPNIALFTTTGAAIGGTVSTSGLTATGAVTLATASGNINIGTSQTTGHATVGGTAQTGTILIGQSTSSQTINIGHGATSTGNTKTIQIGENGAAGSATLIDIGPATASATGTVTFNTATVVTIANTGGSALSVAGNITGGNVFATSVSASTVITTPVAFGNLVAVSGARAFVNDANIAAAANFGATISGGGANVAPVWSDGTSWYIG